MPPEADSLGRNFWVRAAIVVWAVMTVAVCARSVVQGHRQSVFPVWQLAGHDWRTGHDIYDHPKGHLVRSGYRYSPLCAALFVPFDLIPTPVGDVACRLLNAAAFLAAVAWWLRRGVPGALTPTQFGLVYLLMAPIALGSLNNGQMNLVMMALLLVCLTAVSAERWNLAAWSAAGAVLLKIYPISLVLLIALIHPRRFLPRFLLAMAVLCLIPFFLQDPNYVLNQYSFWWMRVRHNDAYRRFWPLPVLYRDVWLLLTVWKVPVTVPQYTLVQLTGAAGCGLLALVGRWRLGPGKRLLFALLCATSVWMLVLGPSPESCTYAVLAPAMAWWLVRSHQEGLLAAHYPGVFGYGLLLLCTVAGTHSRGIELYHVPGLQPIAVLAFAAGALAGFAAWCARGRAEEPAAANQPAEVRLAA
jgi:hypothetical protein